MYFTLKIGNTVVCISKITFSFSLQRSTDFQPNKSSQRKAEGNNITVIYYAMRKKGFQISKKSELMGDLGIKII